MGTILYVATNQGVVTVKKSGTEWEIGSHGLKNWDVNEIAIQPGDPLCVYAATRGDGVLRSTDGGETWSKPNRGSAGPGKVKCVTIDPHDSNTIYAGGEPIAVWVSHDRGESWSSMNGIQEIPGISEIDYPVLAVEPHVRDIVIHPGDSNTLYVTLQVGYMAKTIDGGRTWNLLNNAVDADAHQLVSRKDQPERLYLSTGGHSHRLGEAPGRALYRSLDGGASWLPMALEFDQEYSIPMVTDPRDEDIVFSAVAYGNPSEWRKRETGAGAALIRSIDGGETWQAITTNNDISRFYPEAITLDPSAPDNMFVATRKGQLFGSTDTGETWSNLGVQVPEVSDLKAAST
jgi:photosystem II stability/assembly factor-like uncharacterized protein